MIECTSVNTASGSHCSFKVTVNANERDKLLDADFWPVGIMVKKFINLKKIFSKKSEPSAYKRNNESNESDNNLV